MAYSSRFKLFAAYRPAGFLQAVFFHFLDVPPPACYSSCVFTLIPMGLPGHRRTHSDKHKRSAHFALKELALTSCAKCHKPVQPHCACRACGFYRGREVVNTSRSVARLLKKATHSGHHHDKVEASANAGKVEASKGKKAVKKAE